MAKAGFVPLLVAFLGAPVVGQTPRPVKLEVDPPPRSIVVGERASINVRLLDADNRLVAAPKDFTVNIVTRLPSSRNETLASAVLKAGQSAVRVELPPAKTEGFVYIWAKQAELRVGGAFLRVKPDRLIGLAPPPLPAPGVTEGGYLLALRYSPQRAFLANGKDRVTVHAFVMPKRDSPLPGFRVRLFDSTGTMNPVPLVIPPGAEEGTATLTWDHEGQAKVEYLDSTPRLELAGDTVINLNFDPPIVGFELQASPPRISLVDACDLVVRLVDEKGTPIATKTRRAVSLALTAGRGDLSARELSIEPDNAIARATFTPAWWGPVTITASTPDLVNVDARLQVEPPLGLLGFSLAGGLLGGYVFMLKQPRSKLWRVPVGALTGFVLLWFCLFAGLSVLPRAAILNPMSVFVISVLGGWAGTGVFDFVLKRLGLE